MEGEQLSPSSSASVGGAVRDKQRTRTAIKVKIRESFYLCKVTDMAEEIGSFCRKILHKRVRTLFAAHSIAGELACFCDRNLFIFFIFVACFLMFSVEGTRTSGV